MKKSVRLICVFTALVFMLTGVNFSFALDNKSTDADTVSVIFTHDMHSHMDADKVKKGDEVAEVGGFARLKTATDDIKKDFPGSLVLDAGDFSMGTPYQTIYSNEASELKMMKKIGFDVTTFGNHEYDYRAEGLAKMLNEATGAGPQIVASNIDWKATMDEPALADNAKKLKAACDKYGVKEYTIIKKNGVKIAVFGLMGESAVDYAPDSGLIFKNAVESAQAVVEKIQEKENPDVIVCLSHCGTVENEDDEMEETEDYLIAEAVPEINFIVSGHTHTMLEDVVQVGNTYIGSCGSYNANIGHIVLKKGEDGYELDKYEIIPLDSKIKPDASVNTELEKYKNLVDSEYFSEFGYKADQVIAKNNIKFSTTEEFGVEQGEEPLGNLIADSYKYAVAQAEDGEILGYKKGGVASGEVYSDKGGVQIAVVPSGVIRGSFQQGNITVADAYNVSSLGYGPDGMTGYPLVRAYLTGKELKAVAEVDASVSVLMSVARLYSSGLQYTYNNNRFLLNRAYDVQYNDGENVMDLYDNELYAVVADIYSCKMLGSVKDKSFGLLEIVPKDEDWNEITNFEDHIIYDHGQELKAWYALTSYIDSFEDNEIPEYYGETHGRKIESKSINPNELMKQPKKMFWIIFAVLSVIAIAFAFALKAARKRQKR